MWNQLERLPKKTLILAIKYKCFPTYYRYECCDYAWYHSKAKIDNGVIGCIGHTDLEEYFRGEE